MNYPSKLAIGVLLYGAFSTFASASAFDVSNAANWQSEQLLDSTDKSPAASSYPYLLVASISHTERPFYLGTTQPFVKYTSSVKKPNHNFQLTLFFAMGLMFLTVSRRRKAKRSFVF